MKTFLLRTSLPGTRMQLTLWYTAIFALLIGLFGVTFYTTIQLALASSFDTTLRMRSQQVAEGVSATQNGIVVKDIVEELPELDATAALVDSHDYNDQREDDGGTTVHADGRMVGFPLTTSSDFICIRDARGHVVYVTPSFEKLHIPSAATTEPMQGRPWYGTIATPNGTSLRLYSTMIVDQKTFVGVVQVGQSLQSLNASMQHVALLLICISFLVISFSALGSYYLAGRAFKPIHRLSQTAREITASDLHQRVPVPRAHDEVQELALTFNQMIARLERAFTQQRQLIADASHELRTPVAVIRSMTELALAQPSYEDEYVTVLREVHAESERLGRLVADLLALAKADEGQIQFDQDLVQLDLLAADVAGSLETLALRRGIALHIQRLMPALVLGDAARLIQAIIVLVENALTYTNPGGSVCLAVEAHQGRAHVIVSDTGIGIAQKDIDHVFERFYRADPARSRAAGGSGLGLAIADWIVRAHQGTIHVVSEVGRGSTFTITLPLAG